MALVATAKTSNTKPIPKGLQKAICYGVVDIGTQTSQYGSKRQIVVMWEIPAHRIEVERDGKMVDLPRAISKRYSFSVHAKSNLGKDLDAWRGEALTAKEREGFDVHQLIGAGCLLSIVHERKADGTLYANINAILPWPEHEPAPPATENPHRWFDLGEVRVIPDWMPQWLRDVILKSDEMGAPIVPPDHIAVEEDPFTYGDDETPAPTEEPRAYRPF